MTTKHTPGPWVVGPTDDTVVTHLGKDGVRYEVAAIDGDYNHPDKWPVMEANARLIAAAPELLGALVEAKRMLGAYALLLERGENASDAARVTAIEKQAAAALAKARGEG